MSSQIDAFICNCKEERGPALVAFGGSLWGAVLGDVWGDAQKSVPYRGLVILPASTSHLGLFVVLNPCSQNPLLWCGWDSLGCFSYGKTALHLLFPLTQMRSVFKDHQMQHFMPQTNGTFLGPWELSLKLGEDAQSSVASVLPELGSPDSLIL